MSERIQKTDEQVRSITQMVELIGPELSSVLLQMSLDGLQQPAPDLDPDEVETRTSWIEYTLEALKQDQLDANPIFASTHAYLAFGENVVTEALDVFEDDLPDMLPPTNGASSHLRSNNHSTHTLSANSDFFLSDSEEENEVDISSTDEDEVWFDLFSSTIDFIDELNLTDQEYEDVDVSDELEASDVIGHLIKDTKQFTLLDHDQEIILSMAYRIGQLATQEWTRRLEEEGLEESAVSQRLQELWSQSNENFTQKELENLHIHFQIDEIKSHFKSSNKEDNDREIIHSLDLYSDTFDTSQLESLIIHGHTAQCHLTNANLRWVVNRAKKYLGRGVSLESLYQVGSLKVYKDAVRKFTFSKGNRFSTYATWWINQAMHRYINETIRTIRLPVHVVSKLNKIKENVSDLYQQLGRKPTLEEISETSGHSVYFLKSLFRVAAQPVSIHMKVGDDEDSEFGDFIEDSNQDPIDFGIHKQLLAEDIQDALTYLTEREVRVLGYRFGFIDGKNYTLEETSGFFGLTRERIRQIEAKALRKLRHPSRSRKLRQHLSVRKRKKRYG